MTSKPPGGMYWLDVMGCWMPAEKAEPWVEVHYECLQTEKASSGSALICRSEDAQVQFSA